MKFRSAVGLEILEDVLVLAQVQSQDEDPYVSAVKMTQLPPNIMSNGSITDVELLAGHIQKVMDDSGFSGQDLIASISDKRHVKISEKFPVLKQSELNLEMEMRMAAHRLFFQDDFQLGFQIFKEAVDEGEVKNYQTVLYAATSQSRVDILQELADALDMNLVSVDVSSLAAVRSVMWQNDISEGPYLIVNAEESAFECFVIWDDAVLFTQSLRIDVEQFAEDPSYVGTILDRVGLFLCAYTDMYPHFGPLSDCLFVSRVDGGGYLFEKLVEFLEDMHCHLYTPDLNIRFDSTVATEGLNLNDYTVAVGLGFKFFEKYNQTLSLTKVQKRLSPILNKKEFTVFLVGLVLFFSLFKAVNLYIDHNKSTIGERAIQTQVAIRALQSGEYLTRQKQLESYQAQIQHYTNMREQPFSKVTLMTMLTEKLPVDITFLSLTITSQRKISLLATAYYQDSIYVFLDILKSSFSNVVISNIKTSVLEGDIEESKFKVTFDWSPK
jgi:hypothetical protein